MLALIGARWHWRIDLLTCFHHIYAIGLAAALVAMAFERPRRKPLIMAAMFGLLINAVIVAPLYWGGAKAPADAPAIRIAFLNVLRSNQDEPRIVDWLRAADPDIIIVNELTPWHADLIRREFATHPHGAALPDIGYYGVGIFSRLPLEHARIEYYGADREPVAIAEARIGGAPVTLASTHLSPPFRPEFAERRNRHAAELAAYLANQPQPLLFAGDLNMTSWSPYFRDLLRAANLRDGRRGFGLRATWPAWLPGIGITIDHALCSDNLTIRSYKIGPNISSDHRPFVVEVALMQK